MAKAINLNSLLRSIHNAVLDAQKITEQQHLRQLRNYFTWTEAPLKEHGIDQLRGGKARTWKIDVPSMHPDAGKKVQNERGEWLMPVPETQTLDIPIMSLVPITAIKIDNMVMEFDVGVTGFLEDEAKPSGSRFTPDDPESHRGPVMLDLGGISGGFFSKKAPKAKVRIEFKSAEPSEAIMRINDHLIKSIM